MADPVFDILHQYSEWLDADQKLILDPILGDDRSHDDLVKQFMAERNV